MTTPPGVDTVDVDHCVREIAAGLHPRVSELTAEIRRCLREAIPELDQDAASIDLLEASIGGNVETLLHAMRYDIDVNRVQAPTAAVEYARRLAQHGVPVHALVRAYRIGQRCFNALVFAEVQATEMQPLVEVAVLEKISEMMFDYIDWISQHVVVIYEAERERWLENQNSLRAMRVREILTGRTPIDVDAATAAVRYPLRWHHLAVVIWCPETALDTDELPRLQRFLRELGDATGCDGSPLFVAVDRSSAWGWIPFRSAPADAVEKARQFAIGRADLPSAGIGTVSVGVGGFRRSHRRAVAARSVAMARGERAHSVIAATDPGVSVAALMAGDIDHVRDWVGEVLGDLAIDSDSDARLRDTLRVFLASGSSYKMAAERLNLHFNTVKYRVGRATARRGQPITTDRLDVELALLLCHWYGSAVLRPDSG